MGLLSAPSGSRQKQPGVRMTCWGNGNQMYSTWGGGSQSSTVHETRVSTVFLYLVEKAEKDTMAPVLRCGLYKSCMPCLKKDL